MTLETDVLSVAGGIWTTTQQTWCPHCLPFLYP